MTRPGMPENPVERIRHNLVSLRMPRALEALAGVIQQLERGQLGAIETEHMPSAQRRYAEWRPERLQRDARGIGPATEALIIAVMARRPHPEKGFRTCLGILRLFRGLDAARVEAASTRAVEIGALSYGSVASILKHHLDRTSPPTAHAEGTPLLHDNIRGSGYYH